MGGNIIDITSTSHYDGIARGLQPNQLLVIDFYAVWCGPCVAIAPFVEQLSLQYPQVKFLKIDVDRQPELASRFSIRAMPTFKFIKENREVTELTGASPPRLSQLVSRFAGPIPAAVPAAASSSSSSSTTSVPAPPAPKPAEAAKPTDQSLLAYITSKDLVCLNQSNDHPLSSILGSNAGPKGSSYLESDVDAELLISISFNEAVKIRAISLFSGVSPGQAPKDVKLFINVPVMDFTTAESMNPAQELVLTPDQVSGEKIELRYVRFQNVRNLHILVKSNQEDEETTRIDSIDLFGTVGATTDKGPLKKIGTNED